MPLTVVDLSEAELARLRILMRHWRLSNGRVLGHLIDRACGELTIQEWCESAALDGDT